MKKVDLGGVKRLLDVGGNLGAFGGTILRRFPHMQVTVFDLPDVAEQVNADVLGQKLGDRLRAVGGDFMKDAYPTGHDLITLVRIFNARNEDTHRTVLRRSFEALPSGGRCLFYEEHVLPDDLNAVPETALWGASFSLISGPGEIQTVSHWKRFFADAGFVDIEGIRGRQAGIVIGRRP
jgi:hypothetical protein